MRRLTKTGEKINSRIGKAIHDHDLITDGDRILVAVSGGKDSLTMLDLLKAIQAWAPVKFDLIAAHIKTDFQCGGCMHNNVLTDIFEGLEIEYALKEIEVLDSKGKTSCFWCSWNKRKTLFETADEMRCNKVAFGHHKDDIVETVLMNLLYNGEISSMKARQELFDGKITIIRPLCYVEEKLIKTFAAESDFPQQLCQCPFGKDSKRKYVKDFVRRTEKETPGINIKTNILKSISRIKADYIDREEGL